MTEIIAYASSTRPNHLWSTAQFNSALPKNRTECDIPLVAAAALAAKDAELAKLRDLIRRNWQGSFWRAVNYRDADEVRAALNGGSDAP